MENNSFTRKRGDDVMSTPKSNEIINLEPMNKSRLRDFNIEEARGWTIDRLLQIEDRINSKIIEYFKPSNTGEFTRIVLNSSILDLGGKLKILRNIGVSDKLIDKIRILVSIRNGFAHCPIKQEISVNVEHKLEKVHTSITNINTTIEVMNSGGKIITKNAFEYLLEFYQLNDEIRKLLL